MPSREWRRGIGEGEQERQAADSIDKLRAGAAASTTGGPVRSPGREASIHAGWRATGRGRKMVEEEAQGGFPELF